MVWKKNGEDGQPFADTHIPPPPLQFDVCILIQPAKKDYLFFC